MPTLLDIPSYLIRPDLDNYKLARSITGMDHSGQVLETSVIEEKALTIYLNSIEVITAMTIGDYPELLAVGFLRNQGMLGATDILVNVEYDDELGVVIVRTKHESDYEAKLSRKTRTSGCAVGTVFGDILEGLDSIALPKQDVRSSSLYTLSHSINRTPSLYLKAGAIHGTVLCCGSDPLVYMEDVGRHNAVDKIAGWMYLNDEAPDDKLLYTTGRLTSEMVIKTALMGIPVLVSRSGFTAWGVDIARQVSLTLIGRLRGRKFVCLSGQERLIFDTDPGTIPEEDRKHLRKSKTDD